MLSIFIKVQVKKNSRHHKGALQPLWHGAGGVRKKQIKQSLRLFSYLLAIISRPHCIIKLLLHVTARLHISTKLLLLNYIFRKFHFLVSHLNDQQHTHAF